MTARTLYITALMLVSGLGLASARQGGELWPKATTAIVLGTSRNTVEVYDEQDKRRRSFITVRDADRWKRGDHVRIYWYPGNDTAERIIKLSDSPQKPPI